MKRRSFISATAMAGAAATVPGMAAAANSPQPANKDIYEFRVYQTKGGGQKNQIKKYLTTAVAPYINKLGGKVGIFTEYGMQEPPKLYVLLTFPGAETYYRFLTELDNNAEYKTKGAEYLTSDPTKPLFNRYETYLLDAFDGIPQFRQPDASRGLLELRIYESYNEDAGRRKVEMFNKGEIALFDKVGLNSVFFGKIIAGPQMPALVYMLAFKDMAQREENWAKFRVHPDWKEMSGKPEYANTVSQVNKIFLVPEEGSQL